MMPYVNPDAVVYVIEVGGRIKIGTSTKIEQRLRDLQASMPETLVLLGTRPGDRKLEGAWHREFRSWRIHGEWFELPETQRTLLLQRLNGEPRVIQLPKVYPRRPHRKKYRHTRSSWKSRP